MSMNTYPGKEDMSESEEIVKFFECPNTVYVYVHDEDFGEFPTRQAADRAV